MLLAVMFLQRVGPPPLFAVFLPHSEPPCSFTVVLVHPCFGVYCCVCALSLIAVL